MPQASHAAAPAPVRVPTPAQLKEFFAQIESGRITKTKLQAFLRGLEEVQASLDPRPLPLHLWMASKGYSPANDIGHSQPVLSGDPPLPHVRIGFLKNTDNYTNTFRIFGRYRRPFVAILLRETTGGGWELNVRGIENVPEFQNLTRELEELYGVAVTVNLTHHKASTELFGYEGYSD